MVEKQSQEPLDWSLKPLLQQIIIIILSLLFRGFLSLGKCKQICIYLNIIMKSEMTFIIYFIVAVFV